MTAFWNRREVLVSAGAFLVRRLIRGGQEPSFDRFVTATMKTYPTPGVAVAALNEGHRVWARGYGFADLEARRPMTSDTILNVGSVTKTVTATAVMQLVEAGKLDLDADVNRSLPFPVRNPAFPDIPITARQLLTHVSSIKDGLDYLASYACGDPSVGLAAWVDKYLHPVGARYRGYPHFSPARPGKVWDYSNVGFGLLGVMIEHLSGQSYADYTVRRIFEPLGMSATGWYLTGRDVSRHATPYQYVRSGRAAIEAPFSRLALPGWRAADHPAPTFVPHCLYSFPTLPDGLMRTSVDDLARFIGAYLQGGSLGDRRILSPETVRAIWTDQRVPRRKRSTFAQGLAWYRTGDPGGAWQHSGGDPGITTFIAATPDGRGVAVIANAGTQASEVIGRRVLGPSSERRGTR